MRHAAKKGAAQDATTSQDAGCSCPCKPQYVVFSGQNSRLEPEKTLVPRGAKPVVHGLVPRNALFGACMGSFERNQSCMGSFHGRAPTRNSQSGIFINKSLLFFKSDSSLSRRKPGTQHAKSEITVLFTTQPQPILSRCSCAGLHQEKPLLPIAACANPSRAAA